jgi:ethanolamine ammonia-lyase small subunit
VSERDEHHTWLALRRYTQARIGLGRAGDSLPTKAVLEFGLAHAQARDAVHMSLDLPELQRAMNSAGLPSVCVHSAVSDRLQYLRRPDVGRRLSLDSRAQLLASMPSMPCEVLIVVADGLSAPAVMRHAVPLLQALQAQLAATAISAPIVIAQQARVALGDEIGEVWAAEQVIVLIGERPGLSCADSLGAYLTFAPRVGRSDAERNCVSNIRREGLSYAHAAHKLAHLIVHARRLQKSGVELKDESQRPASTVALVEQRDQ